MIVPFAGRKPDLGELVSIDFKTHAGIQGVVHFLSDEHITLMWNTFGVPVSKRFRLEDCVLIRVLD
jgi:hypothetical protein